MGGGGGGGGGGVLRNAVYEAFHKVSLSVRLEAGSGLGKDKAHTHPADILCYGTPRTNQFRVRVQQGDSLGPLLFAIVWQKLIRMVSR